ncbi:glutathione S-transferase family protein [Congregibacter variabilis]|uniref:Glutathione S-transferase family protein n=1 Tax=Congregibacter variabilis TaxID=3081200 RepID=A0ABZ0HZB4_9GAMM|nr:glutathione S-transferase family protein [Congregibacter sp. IMCC43200]
MDYKKLVLHHYPATRSVRARWMLLETIGTDFELRRVNLYGGAQYEPEFLALNPNHNVPALEIHWSDGNVQVLLESAAIVEWLADSFPEKGLAPPLDEPRSRAEYLRYLHFGATWMDMMLWQIRAHRHLLKSDEADPRTVERYENKFRNECEPQIADCLHQGDYILGNDFSAADVIIGYNVFWARGYGLCQDEVFGSYLSRLKARTAMQQALNDLADFAIEAPESAPDRAIFTG